MTRRHTSDEKDSISFTSKLIAYHRYLETQSKSPLIKDQFAEMFIDDMDSFIAKHGYTAKNRDYSIVRTYYIEEHILRPWCGKNNPSQIVLLGAGFDTRAYRLELLKKGKHIVFEIDREEILARKLSELNKVTPLVDLFRISSDLNDPSWFQSLLRSDFNPDVPTLWILEGLLYYIPLSRVKELMRELANMMKTTSEFVADICIPALASMQFGLFTRYFHWGLDFDEVYPFFKNTGWEVEVSYADAFDQGRDVGQNVLMFVYGTCSAN